MRYYLIPVAAASLMLGACTTEESAPTVSFKADVMPIIDANCAKCHNSPQAPGTVKSGLRMDTYEGLMKGTKFGPVIDPGYADTSVLNQVIEGRVHKSIQMPHGTGDRPLTDGEQKIIRDWVEQGAQNN